MKSLVVWGGLALVAASSQGCVVDDRHHDDYDDYPPTRTVTPSGGDEAELSVEWTIDGSNDPGICHTVAAAYAYIEIDDDVGIVDENAVDCEDFGYDAPLLPPGSYWATVVLRDADDRDLTTPAQTDRRDLLPGDSDYVVVDFPLNSFF